MTPDDSCMLICCRAIAQQTRADRHTLMFSATWPSSIQKLAAEFLCNPVKVTIGSQDLSASHSVTQVKTTYSVSLVTPGFLSEVKPCATTSSCQGSLPATSFGNTKPQVQQCVQRVVWQAYPCSVHQMRVCMPEFLSRWYHICSLQALTCC